MLIGPGRGFAPPSTLIEGREPDPTKAESHAAALPPLRIGLLNNMPDAALIQTERQFRRLVGPEVDLRLFAFRDTPRGLVASAHLQAHYAWHETLPSAGLDALIISGSEPRLPRLEDEPSFAAMSAVVDWAAANTLSTLFSCLAAHAAVLHLDGIRRTRMPAKLAGIFSCATHGTHAILNGMPAQAETPHSRWHDLAETDLVRHGYMVLRRSDEVGVDLFVREGRSLFVFLQGHPEYDLTTLAREYRRDLKRFLDGSSTLRPSLPANYFSDEATAELQDAAVSASALSDRGPGSTIPSPEALPLRPSAWPSVSALLFQNWLACVETRRRAQRDIARR